MHDDGLAEHIGEAVGADPVEIGQRALLEVEPRMSAPRLGQ
jgi:hypothetical protein